MREHRTWDDGILVLQLADEFLHIVLRVEAHAVHAGIQLDMDRETGYSLFLSCLDERIEQTERVNLRLQVVIEHGLEGGHLRIHNHDVAGDAVLAQRNALIGYSHSQIVYTMILQGLGYLHGTCTVAVCLDHAYQLGFRLHKRTIVVQIGYHGVQIHLQRSLMYLLYQQFGELVETKLTGALQQNHLIAQGSKHLAGDEFLYIREEELL